MSLELRWIFENGPPVCLQEWFSKNDFLGSTKERQIYQDIYLFNPEVDYTSLKFRNENLDIKWKRSSYPFELKSRGFTGIVEDWVFWEWRGTKMADKISGFIESNSTGPWLQVRKESLKYNFQYMNHNIIPVQGREKPDCSIELVTFTLNRIASLKWWSLGIDLFSLNKVLEEEKSDMEKIAAEFLRECPLSELTADFSYSYPKLFQFYRVAIQ